MARGHRSTSPSHSDDDTPEAVSFGSSKKVAKGERHAVEQFHAAQKQKRKEKNRATDQALKQRAAQAKVKDTADGVGQDAARRRRKAESLAEEESEGEDFGDSAPGGPSRRELEERMARAMMEAEDEEDDEDGSGLSDEDVAMEAEDGDEEDGDNYPEDDDEDEEMDSGEDEDEDEVEEDDLLEPPRQKQNYLPDYLFKSALSSSSRPSKIVFNHTTPPASTTSPQRRRKRAKRPSKDIVVGSRVIRTLAKPSAVTSSVVAKAMVPPRRVERFMKTSLNLKGDLSKSRSKGWTRRPANLGVMKRSGPAANFVRNE